MSLDAAEIDLSRSFTPGMGYVALSRVRSIEGVYLKGINNLALAMHPQIFAYDERLREASEHVASMTDDWPEAAAGAEGVDGDIAGEAAQSGADGGGQPRTVGADFDEQLFSTLRTWRMEQARRQGVAPFMIAHDAALQELARIKPVSVQRLLGVKGFGPKKVEQYGAEIVAVIAAHTGGEVVDPSVWTAEQDNQLMQAFKSGVPLASAADQLGRDPDDLWKRLQQLL
jgi:superfamily II DNA helicase RecQ